MRYSGRKILVSSIRMNGREKSLGIERLGVDEDGGLWNARNMLSARALRTVKKTVQLTCF